MTDFMSSSSAGAFLEELTTLGDAELEQLRASPARRELPNNRATIRRAVYYPWRASAHAAMSALGRKMYVDCGIEPETRRVREIFARGGSKVGEDIDSGLDQIATALSVLLQIDEPIERLAEHAPRLLAHYLVGADAPDGLRSAARGAIAAILHEAIQIEAALDAGDLVLVPVKKLGRQPL